MVQSDWQEPILFKGIRIQILSILLLNRLEEMNSSPLVLTSDRLMERIDWIRNKDMGNWTGIAQLNGFYRHQIPSILQLLLMKGPPIDMKTHLPFGWMGTAEDDLGDEGSRSFFLALLTSL